MSLSATLKLIISATQTRSIDLAGAESNLQRAVSKSYTDGIGVNQADRLWSDKRTLAASATENIDLNGVLSDIYGLGANFARIKAIVVIASDGNTNDVQVTRPASNGVPLFMAAGDGVALAPGDFVAWGSSGAPGKAVTAGTGDLLTVTNSGGTTGVDYEIIVLGASA